MVPSSCESRFERAFRVFASSALVGRGMSSWSWTGSDMFSKRGSAERVGLVENLMLVGGRWAKGLSDIIWMWSRYYRKWVCYKTGGFVDLV